MLHQNFHASGPVGTNEENAFIGSAPEALGCVHDYTRENPLSPEKRRSRCLTMLEVLDGSSAGKSSFAKFASRRRFISILRLRIIDNCFASKITSGIAQLPMGIWMPGMALPGAKSITGASCCAGFSVADHVESGALVGERPRTKLSDGSLNNYSPQRGNLLTGAV